MVMPLRRLVVLLLLAVFATVASAAEEIQSGLQVGERPGQFNVKDCTGPAAGKTLCYYCRYGRRPVIGVFTRQINADVGRLVQQIDEALAENRDKRLAAFVVYVTDEGFAGERRLKKLADEYRIRRTPLTIYHDRSSKLTEEYRLADDAALTLMMWVDVEVKANHAFREAKLNSDDIRRIVADAAKILE